MHYHGILLTPRLSYQTLPLQKKNEVEDKGGNHGLFEHLMHSWVGYELVKVLLKYGLSPKLRSDLNKWSPELFELFSYFGEKQQDPSKSPTRLLNILIKNTEHSSYFGNSRLEREQNLIKWPIPQSHWLYWRGYANFRNIFSNNLRIAHT